MKKENTQKRVEEKLYEIVDSFLVEAKDQNGNDRTLEKLNQDRHLAVENLKNLLSQCEEEAKKEKIIEEIEEEFEQFALINDFYQRGFPMSKMSAWLRTILANKLTKMNSNPT